MAYQGRYGARLHDFLETRLKPPFLENDLDRVLAQGWDFNEIGTFKMLQALYDPEALLAFERRGREEGLLYCGISSAGPSVFGLSRDQATIERAAEVLERELGDLFGDFRVGKAGERIVTKIEVV